MISRRKNIIATAYKDYGLMQLPTEIDGFTKFFSELNAKNIMEIGSCFGGMFYIMSKLSDDDGIKISVDYPFYENQSEDERYKRFTNNVKTFSKNTHLVVGNSHSIETLQEVKKILKDEKLDFLFIDGDHSYEGVKQDFEMYRHLVKDGGYIAFHDINDTQHHRNLNCYVAKFWNEIVDDTAITFNVKSFAMGIGVIQVFDKKRKLDLEVYYERPNKITIYNKSYPELELYVSIRDNHTKIPIYFCNIKFAAVGHSWWIQPLPDYDFYEEPNIESLLVEFYDMEKNFIDSKEVRVKENAKKIERIGTRLYSAFDCLWINYKQMFIDKIYDGLDIHNLDTVIDIGANVGIFTNYITERGAKMVHAIEPASKAYDELKNQFYYYNWIKCHKIGIGGIDENKNIYINNENSTICSFLSKTSDNITEENVNVKTLQTFYNENNILKVDLIKIDIEGMEYEVIESTTDFTLLLCERYLIEYHMNETNEKLTKLVSKLERLGYEVNIYPDVPSNVQGYLFAKKKSNKTITDDTTFPKTAFVTFTNEYYLPIVERLVKSVVNNSSHPIIVYGINCDINFSYPGLYTKRLNLDSVQTPKFNTDNIYKTRKYGEYEVEHKMPDGYMGVVDRNDIGTYITLSRKPIVILDAINNGLQEGIFLDADGLAKENIDTAFNYLKECEDYPLVGKGLFEYMLLNGIGNPHTGDCLEKPLMNLLGVQNRTMHYVSTNFILFTNKMKSFIEEWKNIADNKIILENNVKYAPYHDETIINVLLWKWKASKHLPIVHYNLTNSEKAKQFYETNKRNYHTDSEWHYIPSNIDDIKYFHGCKSIEELEKTISLIEHKKNKFKFSFEKISFSKNPKIAILTLFDSNYKDLGTIALPNRIKYAKTHGYDCIYFTDTIDNSRPPQWSKVKAVEYFLNDYDWIWWLDIDALIMDKTKKLESIIDEKYDIIFTENKYSVISNGSSFFRNTEFTKKFLKECYNLQNPLLKDIEISTFDHEQKPMRKLYTNVHEYRDKIKLVHERVCNSFYQTDNKSVLDSYPNWNTDDNIYGVGDFVVNFCGRTKEERILLMKKFIVNEK